MTFFKPIQLSMPALRVYRFLILFYFFGGTIFSQQPAYFKLGEDQFSGIQIYDVVQDKDLNYWFATNEGLFLFDHYNYQKIDCKEAKSTSVFDFVVNSKGTIYCHNLNNQIFQIRDKEYTLFYELEPDEVHPDLSLIVSGNDHLLVGSKKIIELSEDGTVIKRINTSHRYLGFPYAGSDKTIYYHLGGTDSVLVLHKEKSYFRKLQSSSTSFSPNVVLKFFSLGSALYSVNLKTKEVYSFDTKKFELTSLGTSNAFESTRNARLYSVQNKLWVAGTLPGVVVLEKEIIPEQVTPFYEDYFISDVYEDHEGNILLSTFDKGILVIPDMKIPGVIHSFRDDPITSLYRDKEMGLLLGSSKGLLLAYKDKTLSTLNTQGKRPIEHLFSGPDFPFILFDDGIIRLFDKRNKKITELIEASLKDAVIVSNDLFYIGTNRGIIKCERNGTSDFKCTPLKNFGFRVYCMAFDITKGILYASTSNGLFYIEPNGEGKPITRRNQNFFPNTLCYYGGKIYSADKTGGILVIKNEDIATTIWPKINGHTEQLSKLIVYKNTLVCQSSKGLFQFDLNGKLLNALNSSLGLSSNRIIDFTIRDDQLWVSHINGVQQIDLSSLHQPIATPLIHISGILVNDTAIGTRTELTDHERKIQFILSSPTLRSRENIHYHYKLEGNDDVWSINDYASNKITYNALAPGSYTFFVKAEKQGIFSKTISHSFSIASPVYSRWWFITWMVLIFLTAVYLLYQWQLNIQQKKSQQINELNASKLTAIQSQMNPHFIFNSLNSIQDLILKGDVEHSYSYITTFSNLVRRTLSYSDKDFIDFEQEIKLIELYLSLEKLRFKKDFSYTIATNGIVDIQIPPMLIQPFIENALVHGLLHKEGEKKLSIRFELKENLICTIEDNGVGREKAKGIKQRQRSEHESFSGKAIHKRFEILSNVFEGQFGYNYEDLQEDNTPTGTKVRLIIPIKHKF